MATAEFHALCVYTGFHLLLPPSALAMSPQADPSKMPQTSWQSQCLGVQVRVAVGHGEGVVAGSQTTRQPHLLVFVVLSVSSSAYMAQSLICLISVKTV